MQKSKMSQKRAPRKKNNIRSQHNGSSIDAGYSDSVKQSFSWGGKPTKSMEFRLAIYEVGAGAATVDGLRGANGVSNQTSSARLSLTEPYGYNAAGGSSANPFISPSLDLEASSFTRFRCKRLKFQYCPQSGTNTTQRMVFAYANDPSHPLINSTAPSQAKLESVSDSIPFSPWRAWSLDVTKSLDKSSWLYTYDGNVTGNAVNDALERFLALGCIGCIASAAGTAVTGDIFGVLYLIADLEFKEFCPVSITRPSLLRSLARRLNEHAEAQEGQRGGQFTLQRSDPAGVDDDSSSTSKPNLEPMHSKDFIKEFQRLRKLGLPADECVTSIRSENPNLSDEVDRLIETAFGKTAHASSSGRLDLVSTSSGHLSDSPRDIVQGKGKGKEN